MTGVRTEALDAILRAYAVHAGFEERRAALAERLAGEGMTEEDLALVCKQAQKASRIAYWLETRVRYQKLIEDLRYAGQKQKEREAQKEERAHEDPPGRSILGQDDQRRLALAAEAMNMTVQQYKAWKWRRTIVQWVRAGYEHKRICECLRATEEEIAAAVEEFKEVEVL